MNWLRRRTAPADPVEKAGPPVTYADWSRWFEAFARGGDDDALLAQAANAMLQLSSGMAETFARRASETLSARLDGVGSMLQAGLSRIRTEQDAVRAILNARSAFVLLCRYAELPCWPDSLRTGLVALVEQHRAERQKTLLQNATEDRSGRLAAAIRNNPLDRAGLVAHRPVAGPVPVTGVPEGSAQARPRRPILS